MDSLGRLYICGYTTSSDFPVTSGNHWDRILNLTPGDSDRLWLIGSAGTPRFPMCPGGFDTTHPDGDNLDMFVLELQLPNTLVHGTFLGGSDEDWLDYASRERDGSLLLTGFSASDDFPTTADAFQRSRHPGGEGGSNFGDVIVCRLSPGLDSLEYSTYIGGAGHDAPVALARASQTASWIAGTIASPDAFPITPDALFTTLSSSFLLRYDAPENNVSPRGGANIADNMSLSAAPNPFNPSTVLTFTLPAPRRCNWAFTTSSAALSTVKNWEG